MISTGPVLLMNYYYFGNQPEFVCSEVLPKVNDSQIARDKSIPLLVDPAPRRPFDNTKVKIFK